MSLQQLQDIQAAEETFCGAAGRTGGISPKELGRFQDRVFRASDTDVVFYYVDPSGSDVSDYSSPVPSGHRFRTLTSALRAIPFVPPGTAPPAPANAYVISLRPGGPADYTIASEMTAPAPLDGSTREVEWWDSGRLYFAQRSGTLARPIVIQGDPDSRTHAGPDWRPNLQFRLEIQSVQHVYLKDLRVTVPASVATEAWDAVHIATRRPEIAAGEEDTRYWLPNPYLSTHHVLLRNCAIDGGSRRPGLAVSGEALKVNQCQSVFVETCDVQGAGSGNGNAIDFVAVQYAHVIDSDLHETLSDWAMYAKGGSAYVRVERNRVHDAPKGFAAGEGTDSEHLVRPWWNYEAYAIQFVDNLVYDIAGTAIGVQGGYDVLIADNTLYNVGTANQVFALDFGERNRIDSGTTTADREIADGAWATADRTSWPMIPNRYVAIVNNVVRIDSASGRFNLFDIKSTRSAPMNPPPPSPPLYATNLPDPLHADAGTGPGHDALTTIGSGTGPLDIRGNYVGVIGNPGGLPDAFFNVNLTDPDNAAFRMAFAAANRDDGSLPDLMTGVPPADSRFLAPVDGGGLLSYTGVTPQPQSSSWTADLDALAPGTGAERPAWPEAHHNPLDYDRNCRVTPGVVGARTLPQLRIVAVDALAVLNRVYGASSVEVDDVIAEVTLAGTSGTGFLQSRYLHSATIAGLHGYEYRIALDGLSGDGRVVSLQLDFGPIEPVDFDGSGLAHLYVITSGGLGVTGPTRLEHDGTLVTIAFDEEVPTGQSSYFFGLCSMRPAMGHAAARLVDAQGAIVVADSRLPSP